MVVCLPSALGNGSFPLRVHAQRRRPTRNETGAFRELSFVPVARRAVMQKPGGPRENQEIQMVGMQEVPTVSLQTVNQQHAERQGG